MSLALSLLAAGAFVAFLFPRLVRRGLAAPRIPETGRPAGIPWHTVRIPTARGKTLHAWFMPPRGATPAPAVAVLHGWGGNAETLLPLARPLHLAGHGLLFFDARCHGNSDDDDFASLPRFAEDLEHALDWLARQPQVDARRLGVVGHSVGAAAALLVAARRPGLGAVVSLAAFAHPARMMERWLDGKGIPRLPLGQLILWYVQRTIGHRFDDIAPCHTIRQVRCPVLIAHGSDDATVPVAEAREIHANRAHDRVELRILTGGHDDCQDLDRVLADLARFLDSSLGPGGDPKENAPRTGGALGAACSGGAPMRPAPR